MPVSSCCTYLRTHLTYVTGQSKRDQFGTKDESIEAEEEKEEKEGQPEGESSSTQQTGKHPKPPNRYLRH
jgi:hypothetical protein